MDSSLAVGYWLIGYLLFLSLRFLSLRSGGNYRQASDSNMLEGVVCYVVVGPLCVTLHPSPRSTSSLILTGGSVVESTRLPEVIPKTAVEANPSTLCKGRVESV